MEVANENYEIILNAGLSLTMVQVSCEVPTGSFCIGGKCNREEPLGVSAPPSVHCTSDDQGQHLQCSLKCIICIRQCFNYSFYVACGNKPPTNV